MAAVQWTGGKCKGGGEAKAVLRHNDKDERLKHEHTNADIDLAKTKDNYSYRGLTYCQKCRAYDNRLSLLEQGRASSGKNARVTMMSLVIYAPKDLPFDKIQEWFMAVGDILDSRYGSNFIDLDVHTDELHAYIDPGTREVVTSRVHGHAAIVPDVDGKLNGKQFSARKNISSLNNAIHEMTMKQYGVMFMDGTKKKGTKSVEELKRDSEKAAAEMEQTIERNNQLKVENINIEETLKFRTAEYDAWETELQQRDIHLNDISLNVLEREADLDETIENYGKAFKANRERRKVLDSREQKIKADEVAQKARERDLEENEQHLAAEQKKTTAEREIFRIARAKLEQIEQTSSVDASLEAFAKNYTKRVPIRERDRLGHVNVKRDENGKILTEEHNCYDDWIAHKKLRQKMMADPYIIRAIELDRQFGDD